MIQTSKTSIKATMALKICALEWNFQFAFEKITPEWIEVIILIAALLKIYLATKYG